MGKQGKGRRAEVDAEDLLNGRVRATAREIVAQIRRVNPSGLDLPAAEMARRYALKSRLQSLLVRRFPGELELRVEPEEPGVVLLVHRPSDMEACHAPLATLDEDARAWVQRQLDLGETGAPSAPRAPGLPALEAPDAAATGAVDLEEAPASKLLRAGQAALEEYDYELARRSLEAAVERSGGDGEAAAALLELLVDLLAADEDALALEGRLSPEAARRADVRLLLAMAAARRGERTRALRLLEGLPGARAAEALATLARAAMEAGDLEAAARDLDEAEARDPAHPALRAIAEAIAARRAEERAPLEAAMMALLEDGAIEAAAARARQILGRWPDSAAARRALDAAEAHRRKAEAERALAGAQDALAAGQAAAALGLLRQALGGAGAEEAPRIQARITAIEAAERARAEAAEIARVVALLQAQDPAEGLSAYAALEGRRREAVRAQVDLPHLGWLEEAGARGEGARTRAAVQAVVALGRAEALVGEAPEEALELLAGHERLLQSVRRGRRLLEEAARRAEERRREAARAALAEALAAEADGGDPGRARALMDGIVMRDLSEEERREAEGLRARLDRREEEQRRPAQIAEARRRGEALLARRWVDEGLAGASDAEERARWAALRAEVQAEVQAAFRVQVLPAAATAALHDLDALAMRGACRTLLPGGRAFLLAQSRGAWVFLRLYDVEARAPRTCVALRVPEPIDVVCSAITDGRLSLVSQEGHLLEIALEGWEVLRWAPVVSRPGPQGTALPVPSSPPLSGPAPEQEPEPPPPVLFAATIEDACVVPGSPMLWIVGCQTGAVVDTVTEWVERPPPARGPSIKAGAVRAVPGLGEPRVAVLSEGGAELAVYTDRTAPVAPVRRLPGLGMPEGIAAAPGGEGLLVVVRESDGAGKAGDTAGLGWLELPLGAWAQAGPLHHLDHTAGAVARGAAYDAAAGITFVLIDPPDSGRELLAFGRSGPGQPAALRYRARVPLRTFIVQEGDGGPVALIASREDRFDAALLGPEPPGLAGDEVEPILIGAIPMPCLWSYDQRCAWPGGKLGVLAEAMLGDLGKKTPERAALLVDRLKKKTEPIGLAALCIALLSLGAPRAAWETAEWGWKRYPDNPSLGMLQGAALVQARRWRAAYALLSRVEHWKLDPPSARHVHHLLATALLHCGEHPTALAVLEQGDSCEGACRLDHLLPLAVPLDKELPWTPEQTALRELARATGAADGWLARGDAAAAARVLDRRVVWEAREVQSLARLAEAHLRVEGDGPAGRLRKALALATFQSSQEERRVPGRREAPLPSGIWPASRLEALRERARAWLDETLGGAASASPT